MVAGVTQAAPVTLFTKADATRLVEWRRLWQVSSPIVPSYTDCFVKLTATILQRHPALQAQWRDDGLLFPAGIHIAVAVDAAAGLFAPVIRNADQLPVQEISSVLRALTEQARAGDLPAEAMQGATFTITNLGMFGVDAFTPIIQLPQSAILGIGRIVREPGVVDDHVVPRDLVTLSLTFDHRVVDGAPAARFLDSLRRLIEHPAEALT
jgi:pyruvate dehydrogenase E2 component (dihydrolipoamide acetyltransferase)